MTNGIEGPGAGRPGGRGQAADLVEALRGYMRLPGVRLAALSALVGLGVVLLASLLLAIVMPEASLVDITDAGDAGVLREALYHAGTMTLAPIDFGYLGFGIPLRVSPLLFVAFPIGGCALGAYLLSGRASGMGPRQRLVWGTATAFPFAVLMLIAALFAGTIESGPGRLSLDEGSVFFLALLWGGLGGALGAWLALRRDGLAVELPGRVGLVLQLARATLVPLALTLAVAAVLGTGIWVVQTARDAADAREDRSLATALADDAYFAGDYGLRYFALGLGAQFNPINDSLLGTFSRTESDSDGATAAVGQLWIRSVDADQLPIPLSASHRASLLDAGDASSNPDFTLLDYGDELPAWVFAPLLLVLMIAPAFFALSGGFGVARAVSPATPALGAAWGALVGPVWAVATGILCLLTQDGYFGQILGDSFFAIVLLAGAALGALGGFVATQQSAGQPSPSPFA